MVSAAKREAQRDREATERRNEQLQAQLNESELLLASHQEQLAELKQAMSEMSLSRHDLETITSSSTAPSTPALDSQEHINKLFDALNLSPVAPGGEDAPPAPPTSFTQLVSPVLRTDTQAFEDFSILLDISRRSGPPSRVTSGHYGSFSGLGLSNLGKVEQPQLSGRMPSNGSTASLSASITYKSSTGTPNVPSSTNTSLSLREGPVGGTPLKETAFYKRVLTEDIEPTLRLDTAPGLSWLARRSVISSMCDGKLIVEPMPTSSRPYHPPCSLCGESGRTEHRARAHQFRTSESETVQRYPLCDYCLSRVRSTCDFLGFLRMVKDGHWRVDGPHAESMAWEESVRLRERMFWSRVGGGVVPAFLPTKAESSRNSAEDPSPQTLPELQASLTSQVNEPDQPSPLGHEVRIEQTETLSHRAGPESYITSPRLAPDQSQFKESLQPKGCTASIEASQSSEPLENLTSSKPCTSPDSQDNTSCNHNRPSLAKTITQSRASSRTEGSGRTINSIAKRAAMFERTSSSENSTSTQNQVSLQPSSKTPSPSRTRDASF